jgi:thiamine pyrophosphokinase
MIKTDFKDYQSILCLNGLLPDSSFFLSLNLPVIAADGAANSLLELGIVPELIIGDLDSFNPSIAMNHKTLHLEDQNSTDFQKSLSYLKTKKLLPAIVVGINGGHLDHILNNINIFLETDCILYAPPIIGYVLKEKTQRQFLLPINSKISLMGIPSASLSSKGLRWELNKSNIAFPGNTSCFNRTKESKITLEIYTGTVLVLVYDKAEIDAGYDAYET